MYFSFSVQIHSINIFIFEVLFFLNKRNATEIVSETIWINYNKAFLAQIKLLS